MVTTMVFAESRFFLTFCNLWRGRGGLSTPALHVRHSLHTGVYPPSLRDEEVELGQCPALKGS